MDKHWRLFIQERWRLRPAECIDLTGDVGLPLVVHAFRKFVNSGFGIFLVSSNRSVTAVRAATHHVCFAAKADVPRLRCKRPQFGTSLSFHALDGLFLS